MQKKIAGGALLLLAGFLLGRVEMGTVRAQSAVHYRVINENNGEKIERELNEIVRTDPSCKPVLSIAPNYGGAAKVILACGG